MARNGIDEDAQASDAVLAVDERERAARDEGPLLGLTVLGLHLRAPRRSTPLRPWRRRAG
jgi:hypothetical protein